MNYSVLFAQASEVNPNIAFAIFIFVILAMIFSYFLPSFIAGARRHQNTAAIVILNILLGWTGLGWIVALIWSFTAVKNDDI